MARDSATSSVVRSRWVIAGAWVAVVSLLSVWLLGTSTGALREQLKLLQFWSLEVCVFVGLLAGVSTLRELGPLLGRRDAVRLVGLAALALGLTLFVAPRTNRIFYDEQIYQSIGQNLADRRQAQVCNDGVVEYGRLQCWSGEYNKQPYAYPHILSLAYRLLGVRPAIAFGVNATAFALTVCAVYLLVLVLFDDRRAAALAALLLVAVPEQVMWSATAAVEPSASLACVTALLMASQFLRSGSTSSLLATGVAAAYAIQFRPESLLILPVIALLLAPRLSRETSTPRMWWIGLIGLTLSAVHIGHLFAVRGLDWGTSEARFSLEYVAANLRVNGGFYLWDERFPPVLTLLACTGLFLIRQRREAIAMGVYFALFFTVDLLFYAGSYNYGADVRYSLMTYPPIAVLAGLGASRVAGGLESGVPATWLRPAVGVAFVFQFLWYAPLIRATTEEAWAARADVEFARRFARDLPANSYVLTHNPGMFHLWGVNGGQLSRVAMNPKYLELLTARYSGGVYVHWNFWCNVHDDVQTDFCVRAVALKPVTTVREYAERDQRFVLYRVTVS